MSTRKPLHTVVVSYNRPELLAETVESYLETVSLAYRLVVVDNGSELETLELARQYRPFLELVELGENKYPGFAANAGFALADDHAKYLHRSDNDVLYAAGWCDELLERFSDPDLGQLGLRTLAEEGPHAAVGGNMVLRREVYDAGARYLEHPWPEVAFEDANLSNAVIALGWKWARVERHCIEHRGICDRNDPYYIETFAARGIGFPEWA